MFPNDRSLAAEVLSGETPTQVNPAIAPQSNGMLGGIMPMLVQYMSAAGQDIGAGKPLGANVNAATQKNLAAQSQAKMLQKILAGGGKITMDGQKFNISGHPDLLKEGGAATGGSPTGTGASTGTGSVAGETTNAPQTAASVMGQILQGNTTLNPPSSPLGNINANDLVGLTPENISAALALKQHQDKLTQESINSQFDNILKLSQAAKLIDDDKKTAEIRNYEYGVRSGFKGSFEEWENIKNSADWKNYLRVKSEGTFKGSFMDYQKELATAKGTHINLNPERIELEKEKLKLSGQEYFGKGSYLKDLKEHKNSKEYRSQAVQFDDPGEKAKFEAEDTVRFIEQGISARQGKIVGVEWADKDQKTIKWTVKWPSGDTETITHAVRN